MTALTRSCSIKSSVNLIPILGHEALITSVVRAFFCMSRTVDVTVTYLEMREPGALIPAGRSENDYTLARMVEPVPEYARFLYTAVGGSWYWTDRLRWSYAEWQAHVARPEINTWVGYVNGAPFGYFELQDEPGPEVQIQAFGLLRQFIGRGLGGALLTDAIRQAWLRGPRRVWVHTCTLDGAHALNNYRARGLRVYKEESTRQELDDSPPGPWPGARAPLGR